MGPPKTHDPPVVSSAAGRHTPRPPRLYSGTLTTAIAVTVVLLGLTASLMLSILHDRPALLGLDVEGGRAIINVQAGAPDLWWGPFANQPNTRCRHGLELA